MPAVTAEATGAADTADQISLHLKKEHRGFLESLGVSACRKNFFSPLNKFSELYKSSENLGFQWRRTPFLGFPRTPFLTVAENLLLYRQSQRRPIGRLFLCVEKVFSLRCSSLTPGLYKMPENSRSQRNKTPFWGDCTFLPFPAAKSLLC